MLYEIRFHSSFIYFSLNISLDFLVLLENRTYTFIGKYTLCDGLIKNCKLQLERRRKVNYGQQCERKQLCKLLELANSNIVIYHSLINSSDWLTALIYTFPDTRIKLATTVSSRETRSVTQYSLLERAKQARSKL